MTKALVAILGLLAGLAVSSEGVSASVASDTYYEILDRGREVSLARSAGLAPWNEAATIYVLGPDGYFKAQEGTNGFACMVGRSERGTRWPICFDPVGAETILPRYIREAELRMRGKTEEEIRADTAARFLSGEYRAPSRTGVAYMLSNEAITSNGRDRILAPPHIMIYAPNVRGADIGVVGHEAHSPMVLFEGDPHAYIIVFVRDTPVQLKSLGPIEK